MFLAAKYIAGFEAAVCLIMQEINITKQLKKFKVKRRVSFTNYYIKSKQLTSPHDHQRQPTTGFVLIRTN